MNVDTSLISASAKAFLGELIDYAGLFPPAGLPLEEAIANYGRYRQSNLSWMLSRFIIPVAKLTDLTAISDGRFQADDPYRFSVLGSGGQDSASFLDGVRSDIEMVKIFREAHGDGVLVDVYEVRLPQTTVASGDVLEINGLLAAAGNLLNENGLRPFYEAALGHDWRSSVDVSVQAIAAYNSATGQQAGFKLRTGGLDAAAFPSQYQVAHVIAVCRDAAVPLKCTAGLHHPIRHHDDGVHTKMHGFINVFAAGIIAKAYNLPEQEIAAVVADENPKHFVFNDRMFSWLDRIVSPGKIETARQENIISFGSCSFEEPMEDLQRLDWLAETDFTM
jgi:hypothetical protein